MPNKVASLHKTFWLGIEQLQDIIEAVKERNESIEEDNLVHDLKELSGSTRSLLDDLRLNRFLRYDTEKTEFIQSVLYTLCYVQGGIAVLNSNKDDLDHLKRTVPDLLKIVSNLRDRYDSYWVLVRKGEYQPCLTNNSSSPGATEQKRAQ